MASVLKGSSKKTSWLIIFLVILFNIISPSIVFGNKSLYAQPINYSKESGSNNFKVSGLYIAMYTLEASGIYASKYMLQKSLSGTIRLSIAYEIAINVTFHPNSEIYDYEYKLTSFIVSGNNVKKSIIEAINKSMDKLVNKTFRESSNSVDPMIKLKLKNFSATLTKTGRNGDVTGITIFDDVYCYEIKYYYLGSLENTSYMDTVSMYREIITSIPLYYYEITYNRHNLGYIREKILIINNGLGQGLSKIIITNSTFFTYGKTGSIGKIGFIGLNTSYTNIQMDVSVINETIQLNITSYAPYRVLLLLDSKTDIKYSNIDLVKYNASTIVLYVSGIFDKPQNVRIKLRGSPIKLHETNDLIGLKGLTVEERGVLSLSDAIFVIIFDISLILILIEIIRIAYRKFNQILVTD
ncbi:hypothetical protein [Staphylothermus hellenicus]|uniref:Uncharacterized protein n=1 Tax=Staphylothermus hellenicus (strain DSM 12710 / JCM 10830 / BK20S6-10-b1 / P8) TaxID=591019 RepID=D7DBG6_STAHD|nr:hypothetical protein [Staphylothermus hellenicus]ADI31513.1 hypothetical protein Shell_0381 [Staphylothermus hellenicus DSM 12710]